LSSVWGGLSSVWGGLSVDWRIQQLRVNLDFIICAIFGCVTTTYRLVVRVMRDDCRVICDQSVLTRLCIILVFLRSEIERNHVNQTLHSLPPCSCKVYVGITHQSVRGSSKWSLPQNSN
jgi:hypothetical protein